MNDRIITALEPQKNHPNRRSVYADGEFVFGIDEETCVKTGICTGKRYSAEELERIREEAEVFDAKNYGFRLIAARRYSVYTLEKKLKERGYSDATVSAVSARLTELGYLNDEEYAKSYVNDAVTLKKKGSRLIARELAAKGIAREVIDRVIEQSKTEHGEEDLLTQLIRKRLTDPSDRKAVKRVFDYCLRRGFGYEEVAHAMRQYTEEEEYE